MKIYKGATGKGKGDALITFAKPDAVVAAIIQFNNLNIGDGYVLKVSKANFSGVAKNSDASDLDDNHDASGGSSRNGGYGDDDEYGRGGGEEDADIDVSIYGGVGGGGDVVQGQMMNRI
jgi:hypothetical protein